MARKNFGKRSIVVGGIILVVILLAGIRLTAAADRTQLTPIEIILRDSMAPLYSGVMQVSSTIANIGNSITLYNELLEENRILRAQIRDLTMRNSMMEEYLLENQRLSELLDIKQAHEGQLDLVAARVIGRNLGNWFDTIIIDKGTNHGIMVNMAVINHQGLVGRVVATSRNTAEVMLLLDRESAVGAMVQRSRIFGVVEFAPSGNYPLQMIHLPHDAQVEEGDIIVTSGLGEFFPRGLRIGYITNVSMAPTGLVQQAKLIPYVEFNTLEEVMVVTVATDLPDEIMDIIDENEDLPDETTDPSDEIIDLPDDEELGEGEDE